MPDLEISQLPELSGPGLATSDVLPLADMSASETKKITAKSLIQAGIGLIDNGSIPFDKIDAPTSTLPDGSVTTDKIQNGAVTDLKISSVDGSTINNGTVTGNKLADITDRGLDQVGGKIGIANQVVAGSNAGITWNNQGLVIGATSPIPSADLPIATTTAVGTVSVPVDSGLSVTGTGELSIAYKTTADSVSGITWNNFGNITSVTPLGPSDLPIATTSELGAVMVPGTGGIIVDASGNVNLSDSGVSPGIWTKVTVDRYGRVTNGNLLSGADIPNISANKITAGELPGVRIADRTIEEIKLADYSTCYVQEGQPSTNPKLGQFWFTPSTSQLRVYGRGSGEDLWLSVGFGALQQANLRWGGTVDASTSTITTLTDIGVSEGLTAGGPIPTPSDELSGLYFVVDTGGSNINLPNVSGETLTPGDWVLCIDQAQGYIALDVSAGGGGGGGASKLVDLTDVNITNVADQELLQYQALSGKWVNVNMLDGGSF